MKKFLAFVLILALSLSLMGCMSDLTLGNGKVDQDPASQQQETAVPEQLVTEAPEVTEAPTEAPEITEASPATEAPATQEPEELITEQLITERVSKEGVYTIEFDDDYRQENSYKYHVPNVNADTAGARSINNKIEERFAELAESELKSIENNIGSAIVEIGWRSDLWKGVLSLTVYDKYDWESMDYCVYYYDTETGTELSALEMLGRLDLNEHSYLSGCRKAIEDKFTEQYGDLTEEQRIDYGYYVVENTIDDLISMEMLPFFVEESGTIGVAAPVPSMAGASYYIQILYPSFNRD